MNFKLQESLGFIIRKTSGRIKTEMLSRFRPWDITPEQWVFLRLLWEQDGLSPQQLSDLSCKDRANTLRILDKLQRKELVMRCPCLQDRRASRIFLTERGRSLKQELEPVVEKMYSDALRGIAPEKIPELRQTLNRIFENLRQVT